jgi:hypothetical protein
LGDISGPSPSSCQSDLTVRVCDATGLPLGGKVSVFDGVSDLNSGLRIQTLTRNRGRTSATAKGGTLALDITTGTDELVPPLVVKAWCGDGKAFEWRTPEFNRGVSVGIEPSDLLLYASSDGSTYFATKDGKTISFAAAAVPANLAAKKPASLGDLSVEIADPFLVGNGDALKEPGIGVPFVARVLLVNRGTESLGPAFSLHAYVDGVQVYSATIERTLAPRESFAYEIPLTSNKFGQQQVAVEAGDLQGTTGCGFSEVTLYNNKLTETVTVATDPVADTEGRPIVKCDDGTVVGSCSSQTPDKYCALAPLLTPQGSTPGWVSADGKAPGTVNDDYSGTSCAGLSSPTTQKCFGGAKNALSGTATYSGLVRVFNGEDITFTIEPDDDGVLYFDGEAFLAAHYEVQGDGTPRRKTATATRFVTAGLHSIQFSTTNIEPPDVGGFIYWKGESFPEQEISPAVFLECNGGTGSDCHDVPRLLPMPPNGCTWVEKSICPAGSYSWNWELQCRRETCARVGGSLIGCECSDGTPASECSLDSRGLICAFTGSNNNLVGGGSVTLKQDDRCAVGGGTCTEGWTDKTGTQTGLIEFTYHEPYLDTYGQGTITHTGTSPRLEFDGKASDYSATGYLKVIQPRVVAFKLSSQEHAKFFINGRLVFEKKQCRGALNCPPAVVVSRFLDANVYRVNVDVVDEASSGGNGHVGVKLEWQAKPPEGTCTSGLPFEPIGPSNCGGPTPTPTPSITPTPTPTPTITPTPPPQCNDDSQCQPPDKCTPICVRQGNVIVCYGVCEPPCDGTCRDGYVCIEPSPTPTPTITPFPTPSPTPINCGACEAIQGNAALPGYCYVAPPDGCGYPTPTPYPTGTPTATADITPLPA